MLLEHGSAREVRALRAGKVGPGWTAIHPAVYHRYTGVLLRPPQHRASPAGQIQNTGPTPLMNGCLAEDHNPSPLP